MVSILWRHNRWLNNTCMQLFCSETWRSDIWDLWIPMQNWSIENCPRVQIVTSCQENVILFYARSHSSKIGLKGTISDPEFQTSLFSEPQDLFFHVQREVHCNKLPIQQFSRKQHIFVKRDNSLLLRIKFRRRKLIQVSVSSIKSFTFWF